VPVGWSAVSSARFTFCLHAVREGVTPAPRPGHQTQLPVNTPEARAVCLYLWGSDVNSAQLYTYFYVDRSKCFYVIYNINEKKPCSIEKDDAPLFQANELHHPADVTVTN
jgi:hypothetical protein